jgi:hypothetical protein
MVTKKKNKVVKKIKGGRVHYDMTRQKGAWFDPLIMNQTIEGVFTKTFDTKSDYKNSREASSHFGKKMKTNYEITKSSGGAVILSEGGGPLQDLLEDLRIGDFIHLEFKHLALPDGTPMPKTIKTKEQLYKWRGGKKEPSWPVWGECWVEKAK